MSPACKKAVLPACSIMEVPSCEVTLTGLQTPRGTINFACPFASILSVACRLLTPSSFGDTPSASFRASAPSLAVDRPSTTCLPTGTPHVKAPSHFDNVAVSTILQRRCAAHLLALRGNAMSNSFRAQIFKFRSHPQKGEAAPSLSQSILLSLSA
jgi:hypothetical protein